MVSCSADGRCSIRDAGVPPVEQDPTPGTMIHKFLCNLWRRWRRVNSSILNGLFVAFVHQPTQRVARSPHAFVRYGRSPPLKGCPCLPIAARDLTRYRIAARFAQPTRSTTEHDSNRKSKGTKSGDQGEMEMIKPSRLVVCFAYASYTATP
jgi:hypothetical protein